MRLAKFGLFPDYLAGPNGRGRSPRRKNNTNKRMTPVGFEPTPFRTGTLLQRLRPLGHRVLRYCCFDLMVECRNPENMKRACAYFRSPPGLFPPLGSSRRAIDQPGSFVSSRLGDTFAGVPRGPLCYLHHLPSPSSTLRRCGWMFVVPSCSVFDENVDESPPVMVSHLPHE